MGIILLPGRAAVNWRPGLKNWIPKSITGENRHYTNNQILHPDMSGIQINPNREQLRAEEADRRGIPSAARQLIR